MLRFPVRIVVLLAALASAFIPAHMLPAAGRDSSTGPRNLILIIGDGMPLASEIAASRYLYGTDNALAMHHFPYSTCVSTWDVTTYNRFAYAAGEPPYDAGQVEWTVGYDPVQGGYAPWPEAPANDAYFLSRLPLYGKSHRTRKEPATDSASAATAYATGVKTDDGNIAWAPGDADEGALRTLFEQFRARTGGAIGVVSTVPFSHATPAAFISHNRDRDNYYAISHEIITRTKPEVVISGGHPQWNAHYMSRHDLTALRRSGEYVLVEREAGEDGAQALREAADAAAAAHKKLFGLFGGAGGALELPVPRAAPDAPAFARGVEDPWLGQAAQAALRVLSCDPGGFALLIEQGTIDGANHAGDFASMIGAMHDLDQAVLAVLYFIALPGDSVTAENTVVIVTADHANGHLRLNAPLGLGQLPRQDKTPENLRGYVYAPAPGAPAYYGRYMYPGGEVAYSTGNHTNELVRLYAWGDAAAALLEPYEGAHYPGTRIIDNTDVYHAAAHWLFSHSDSRVSLPHD